MPVVSNIFLGDMISRGPYSTETVIYLQSLKKQAEEAGSKFELLIGNHEHCLINQVDVGFFNIYNIDTLQKIIKENIETETFKVAYGDNRKNIICIHAGMEKEILIWAVTSLVPSAKEELTLGQKVPSEEVYRVMKKHHIQIEDVAKWMNQNFKQDHSWKAPLLREYHLNQGFKGIINSRKKTNRRDLYDIASHKTYKATQFVGHTTTEYHSHLQNATFFGAIKKINHNFYLDYDLLRGKRAFVALEGNHIYQVMSTENGLDKNSRDPMQEAQVPSFMQSTLGCFHGNTKDLDISKWNIHLIGKLPEIDKHIFHPMDKNKGSDSKEEAEKLKHKMLTPAYRKERYLGR